METTLNKRKNAKGVYWYASFYVVAGVNHFINPHFYYPLIPDFLPFPVFINISSGILEITLGLALFFGRFRKFAGYAIAILLLLFIPSHVYFISIGSCIEHGLCVPEAVSWFRLLIIHPLLLYLALLYAGFFTKKLK